MRKFAITVAAVLGLVLAFYPTLFSGFARMQYDAGDTRFVGLVLEHSYQWISGGMRADFWSPPFFFPARGTLAFSENMIGSAPLYWLFRLLRADPLMSMQLWAMGFALLNFFGFYWLAGIALPVLGVSRNDRARLVASFFFAFCNSRIAQLGHPQLLPQVFSLLALGGLIRSMGPDARRRDLALFYLGSAWQFLAAVYLGWFWFFCLGLGWVCLCFSPFRRGILPWLKRHCFVHLGFSVLALALMLPILGAYLAAGREVGFRDFGQTLPMVAEIRTWFYLGPDNLLYGWVKNLPQFEYFPFEIEHRIGLGLVTWAVCLFGIFRGCRASAARRWLAIFFTLLFITFFHWKGRTLWYPIFLYFPGANAIRSVTRLGLFLLIPLSLGLALAMMRMRARKYVVALVIGFCFLEQISSRPSFVKSEIAHDVAALVARIPRDCPYFYYFDPERPVADWSYRHLDAMAAALETGVPTLNGYSGNFPAGWNLHQMTSMPREAAQSAVKNWLSRHQLDAETHCFIEGNHS